MIKIQGYEYIIKETPNAHQFHGRLGSMPAAYAPYDIQSPCDHIVVYRKVVGTPAQDVDKVMRDATALWHTTSSNDRIHIEDSHRKEYVEYCRRQSLHLSCSKIGIKHSHLQLFWHMILTEELTPVHYCHCDMTLENCIDTGEGIVFIDPGWSRGLLCREIDQSKLLQSLRGWHELKGYPKPAPCTFNWRPIHFALYATHLIRLLNHNELHTEVQLMWAVDQLKGLTREYS